MAENKKNFDFKNSLSSRAYTLLVCHRWKIIDEELFGSKDFRKRSVEQLQESENTRLAMHKGAMEELTRIEGFSEVEAHKMLQDECERLVKEKFRKEKDDEVFCGCCRIILKRDDFEKHSNDKNIKLLHDHLAEEIGKLKMQQTQMRFNMQKDKLDSEKD